MKRMFFYSVLLGVIFMNSCKKEDGTMEESTSASQTLILTASADDASNLQIQLKGGLKSYTAEEFTSTVSPGDTMKWTITDASSIQSILGIRIKTCDCENLFKDGILFNEDSTTCYGVISEDAYGSAKYDIGYLKDGNQIWVDPVVKVDPPA